MAIVVVGAVFVDVKGFPEDLYLPTGRNAGSVEIARESERGIIDIETLTETNQKLIQTMDEVLEIQQAGRQKRRDAEQELQNIEKQLREKMLEMNMK